VPGGNHISGRADLAHPFREQSPPLASLSAKMWPPTPATQPVSFPLGLGQNPSHKSNLVCFEVSKCVWQQPCWFILWEPKCPSEVSEPNWASVQTTVCEDPTDTVGSRVIMPHAWGQDMTLAAATLLCPSPSSYVPRYTTRTSCLWYCRDIPEIRTGKEEISCSPADVQWTSHTISLRDSTCGRWAVDRRSWD